MDWRRVGQRVSQKNVIPRPTDADAAHTNTVASAGAPNDKKMLEGTSAEENATNAMMFWVDRTMPWSRRNHVIRTN